MQDGADAPTLLLATARFLAREVVPAIADPALAFRVRIAANLATVVARELQHGPAAATAERARLVALLGEDAGATVTELDARLVEELRRGSTDPEREAALLDHLQRTLIETLSIANPRFSTAPEIE